MGKKEREREGKGETGAKRSESDEPDNIPYCGYQTPNDLSNSGSLDNSLGMLSGKRLGKPLEGLDLEEANR